jgi:hypothetical protein
MAESVRSRLIGDQDLTENQGIRRKALLVDLGRWGIETGRGWLVQAVTAALQREGLRDA